MLNDYIIRIAMCIFLTCIIGIERQYRHGSVGLRTNVLVAIGSFMFNWAAYSYAKADLSRIASSVVSGIGFIGAGIIIKDGFKVKGLNTAATLWCVAAIGILTSCGMLYEASIGTFAVVFSNIVLRIVSLTIMEKIKKEEQEVCIINLSCKEKDEKAIRDALYEQLSKNNLSLQKFDKKELNKNEVSLEVLIITTRKSVVEELVKFLAKYPGILSISFEHSNRRVYEENDDDDE
jgi:putative Mg2+ transporter-C (MgtC) family protein